MIFVFAREISVVEANEHVLKIDEGDNGKWEMKIEDWKLEN